MAIKHNYKKMRKLKIVIWFLVLAGIAYFIFQGDVKQWYHDMSTTTVNQAATPEAPKLPKGVEEVMNRADFKKQQELQAKEIYLLEEKKRVQAEYDAKLADIEKQLEEVRGQKVSFQ